MAQAVVAGAVWFAGKVAVGIAISYVTKAVGSLFQDTEGEGKPQNRRKVTVADSTAPRQVVYGETRVGGNVSFFGVKPASETSFGSEEENVLFWVVDWAHHPCDSIQKVWWGDDELSFDVNGNETGKYAGVMKVTHHLGEWDQDADADLVALFDEKTTNDRGRNVCYSVFQLLGSGPLATKEIKQANVLLRGRKVYDWRDPTQDVDDPTTWKWSANSELCAVDMGRGVPIRIHDGTLERIAGFKMPNRRIEFSKATVYANICDEDVPKAEGGTQKRYQCNGRISADGSPKNQMQMILNTMGGRSINFGGRYAYMPAYARLPVKHLTTSHIRGRPPISLASPTGEMITRATGKYYDKDQNWTEVTSNEVVSSEFEASLNGRKRRKELPFELVNNHLQVQQLCKIAVGVSRQMEGFDALFDENAEELEVGDVFTFDNDVAGYDAKQFEVLKKADRQDPDGDGSGILLSVLEYDPSNIAWSTGDQNDLAPRAPSVLPAVRPVAAPSSLTVDIDRFYQDGSVALSAGTVLHAFPVRFEFRWRPVGSSDYSWSPQQESSKYSIVGLTPGEYEFSVRAWNAYNVDSAWKIETESISAAALIPRPTGMTVVDGIDGNQFAGPDCKIDWNDVALSAHGVDNSDAADSGHFDRGFRSYHLEIYAGTIASHPTLLYSKPTRESQFTLAYDANRALSLSAGLSGAQRFLVFKVFTVLENGQRSDPAVLEVSNKAPGEATITAATPLFGAILADFTPTDQDADLAGKILRYSTTSGYDPAAGEGTLGFKGNGPASIMGLIPGTTYFLRGALYDLFGEDGLNWTSEIAVTTSRVRGSDVAPGSITSVTIGDNSIEGRHIRAEEIDTIHLAADSVDAVAIQGGSVQAQHLSVESLDAITAKAGVLITGVVKNKETNPTGVLDFSGEHPSLLLRSV